MASLMASSVVSPPASRSARAAISMPGDGQAFHRPHRVPVHLADRDEAAVDDGTVDQDRAGSALPLAATFLGPGEPEVLAQDVQQAAHAGHLELDGAAVDDEAEAAVAHPVSPISAASTRSGVAGSSWIHTPVASWMAATTAGAATSMGS